MKPLIGLLLIVSLFGCAKKAAESDSSDEAAPTAVELATVKTGAADQYVELTGSFVPAQGDLAKLSPPAAGRLAKVLVNEGDSVSKGEVLAYLDPGIPSAQASSAHAGLAAAQAQVLQSQANYEAAMADQANALAAAKIGLQQANAQAKTSVAQARFALQQADADLARLKAGARPLELQQAHEATVQAEAAKARAQTEYDRDNNLWAQGNIAKRQLDDAKTALDTTTSALAAARDSEALLKQGARPEEIRSAQAKADAAKDAYDSAQTISDEQVAAAKASLQHAISGNLQVQAKKQDLVNSREVAAQRLADVQSASAGLGQIKIVAPFDGKVIKRNGATGEVTDPTSAVIVLQRTGERVDFVANGLPDQVRSISPGMKVEIEARGGTYDGAVTSVSSPDTAGGLASVRIAVEGAAGVGSFGNAKILTKHLSRVVLVPSAAIAEKDGKYVVFKSADDTAKLTEVELGPEVGDQVAVLSGVKAGDSIVASGANELDDGAKIVVAPAKSESKDPD